MVNRNLTVSEAATHMGVRERFIRRLIAERRIDYLKLGKHIRIPVSSILEFEAASKVKHEPSSSSRDLISLGKSNEY